MAIQLFNFGQNKIYPIVECNDTLTSTDTKTPLSANQGRVLRELIEKKKEFEFKIIESFPVTGEKNVIYLIRNNATEGNNIYNEYIWINNKYELVGQFNTEVDLSAVNQELETLKTRINNINDIFVFNTRSILKTDVDNLLTAISKKKLIIIQQDDSYATVINATGDSFDNIELLYVDDNNTIEKGQLSKIGSNYILNTAIQGTISYINAGKQGNHYTYVLKDSVMNAAFVNLDEVYTKIEEVKNSIPEVSGGEVDLSGIQTQITNVKTTADTNTTEISKLKTTVNSHDTSINGFNTTIDTINSTITQLRKDIDAKPDSLNYTLPTAAGDTLGGVKISYVDYLDTDKNELAIRIKNNGILYANITALQTSIKNAYTQGNLAATNYQTIRTELDALKTKVDGLSTGGGSSYTLPTASNTTLGGIKTGYTENGYTDFKVRTDTNGNAYVDIQGFEQAITLPTFDDYVYTINHSDIVAQTTTLLNIGKELYDIISKNKNKLVRIIRNNTICQVHNMKIINNDEVLIQYILDGILYKTTIRGFANGVASNTDTDTIVWSFTFNN